MAEYPDPPADVRRYYHDGDLMTEAEFLGRISPHPAVAAHTAAVVERVQSLAPPSLVKLDRGEALITAATAWRNLELGGQYETSQWWDSIRHLRDLVDKYQETT